MIDIRSEEEKKKDYSIIETVGSADGVNVGAADSVNWVEKPRSTWRTFPAQNQYFSDACVAETARKMLRVAYADKYKRDLDFSSTYIYQQRINKPEGGMGGVDVFRIMKNGTTLDALVTSDLQHDYLIDAYPTDALDRKVAQIFKIGNFVQFPIQDIETVASTIQKTGKAVMVWFYFTSAEWSPFVPTIKNADLALHSKTSLKHSVAAVDFTIYKGEKALIIEDSAHFGGLVQRVVTQDFFNKRNFFSAYALDFSFVDLTHSLVIPPKITEPTVQPSPEPVAVIKPKYTFSKELHFIPLDSSGRISNSLDNSNQRDAVIALQNILKYEGLFPTNVRSTGYYGAITARAVDAFQRKYKVASVDVLNSLKGRNVGPKTIAKLNELYS